MLWIRLALRNTLRHPRRTLLTAGTVLVDASAIPPPPELEPVPLWRQPMAMAAMAVVRRSRKRIIRGIVAGEDGFSRMEGCLGAGGCG